MKKQFKLIVGLTLGFTLLFCVSFVYFYQRAPELAEKWLDEMAREADEGRGDGPRGAFDDRTGRSTVLLQMAIQAADSDPKAAAGLATESLRDGVSFGFQWALIKIQEKDFDLGRPVFRAALTRLRIAGVQDPNELLILYSYLYTPGGALMGWKRRRRRRRPRLAATSPTPRRRWRPASKTSSADSTSPGR